MTGSYQLLIAFTVSVIGASAWYPGEKPICPIPTECPLEDPKNYTVHLAHESDCTKFYKCAAGDKVEMQCPESWQGGRLHFHRVLQVCAYPKDAGCENPPDDPCANISQESEDKSNSGDKSSNSCGKDSSDDKSSNSCGKDTSEDKSSSSDDKDTSEDKSSSSGDKDTSEDKSSSSSDKDTSEDKSSSSSDIDSSESTRESDEISSSGDKDSSSGGCSSESSQSCSDEEDLCPPDSDGKKVPHECACDKYYVCKNGELVLQSCSEGQHWSNSRNKCVRSAFAYCT